ncbi:low-density lipoprotein receptor class A domain-containing protein 2 [Sarcophilus harrisii]|uniref:low-density lipoprotein receptor class A domain-containing protein 2 n=1 Tax=Sarcophilus harrisii TaxID=9305 RepID=UPI001301E3F9|nr:low-density lipoprotein receptor class A domain-containing protein 2 [Sarcophilus harrisii]
MTWGPKQSGNRHKMACLRPRAPFLGLPLSLLLLGALVLVASAMEAVSLVDFCDQMLHGDGMIIRSHPDSQKFYFVAAETDCWLTVQAASPQDRVLFQFRFFLVYSLTQPPPSELPQPNTSGPSQVTEGPCTAGSSLQFYDGPAKEGPPLGGPLCGLTIPGPILSTGRFLSLRLVTRGQQPRVDFIGDFTSFRLAVPIPGSSIPPCNSSFYFLCRNKKCIPPSLVCDPWGIDNCGDGSDQTSSPPASCRGGTIIPIFQRRKLRLTELNDKGNAPGYSVNGKDGSQLFSAYIGHPCDFPDHNIAPLYIVFHYYPLQLQDAMFPAVTKAAPRTTGGPPNPGSSEPQRRWPAPQEGSATGSPRTLLASLVLLGSVGGLGGLLWCCCCCPPGRTPGRTRAAKLLPGHSSICAARCSLGLLACLGSGRVTPWGAAEQAGQAGGQGLSL